MRLSKSIVFLATLALLLVAAVPAMAADTVKVTIDNRTGAAVSLTLNGPGAAQTVALASGKKVSLLLEPGTYTYRYEACGHMNRGTFSATAGGPTWILKKCAGEEVSRISINNRTGNPFILTLKGAGGTFGFWIGVGGGNKITVPAGGYQYTSTACGSPSGTLKASARLPQPLIWKWTCSEVTISR